MSAWNPSDKDAAITLSNTNHTATTASGDAGVRGTKSHSSGKWYIEFTATATGTLRYAAGFARADQLLNTGTLSHTACVTLGGFFSPGGGSNVGALAGHVIQIAIDLSAGLAWWRIDGGTWNGNGGASPDPATGTNGAVYTSGGGLTAGDTLFPFCDMVSFGGTPITVINTGDSSFANAPPTGFVAWDAPQIITNTFGVVIS